MKLFKIGVSTAIATLLLVGCETTQECSFSEICLENNIDGSAYVYSLNYDSTGMDTIWTNQSRCFQIDNVEIYEKKEEVVDKGAGILIYEYNDPVQVISRSYYPSNCVTNIDIDGSRMVHFEEWCTNGILDLEKGEIDIDCGEFCGPCGDVNLSCSIANNTVSAVGSYTNSGVVGQIYSNNSGNSQVFFVTPFYMTFSLINQTFDGSRRLYYTGWSEGEISVHADLGSSSYYPLDQGKIYVEKLSTSQFKMSFCEMKFIMNDTVTNVNGSFVFTL